MRLLKKWDKITRNPRTDNIEPYRQFNLTTEEIEQFMALRRTEAGEIISSKESEELLKQFLDARGMGSLLYPELERDDWSGYVACDSTGKFYMY